MSDFNSSLPVRTETNGDVAAKIVDGTLTSQALAVDAAGLIGVKLNDGAGTAITSQVNGAQQALDVGINVAGVQIDPRQIRALTAADVVTANQGAPNTNANAWFVELTDGTNNSVLLASGELTVAVTQPLPAGTNVIGKVSQDTSPWITQDTSDGSVTGGTAGTTSMLAGGIHHTVAPTLTDGQQAALQVDASGRLIVVAASSDDHNYGTVGAGTLRTAAQIGNATGAANFGAGATGAQTLRVASNLYDSTGTPFSATNPLPVTMDSILGSSVSDYKDASSVAANASDNHDYTVTAGKTLYFDQVIAAGSGKTKMVVAVETSAGSGTFTTKFVQFNSTADTSMDFTLSNPIAVAAGVRVRVTMTNIDKGSQDLYSTICGSEI